MMGPGHALSGAAAGFMAAFTADVVGQPVTPATAILAAGLAAGAALLPDLDHPAATVSDSFGPVTNVLAVGLSRLSSAVYHGTKLPRDENRDGGHRGLTHTWAFAVVVGGALTAGIRLGGRAVVLVALFVLLSLALRGLMADTTRRHGWMATTLAAGALTVLAGATLPAEQAGPWLGAVVTLGCLVHCWGDSLTVMGCPWMWPIPIAGRAWYPIGVPGALRFKAGSATETRVVMPLLGLATIAAAVVGIPGLLSHLIALLA